MTTIREVAEMAGVSYATVFHVINNTRLVSPETRECLLAAREVGSRAVNLLVERISKKSQPPVRLVLPPELIVRRSTQLLVEDRHRCK